MNVRPLSIVGAAIVEFERHDDERGNFARAFCSQEFERAGLPTQFVQSNVSSTERKNTLRGMHYQAAPGGEGKLIACLRGAVYDVILDLRPDSRSYRKWLAFELSETAGQSIYAPPGVAHGFLTLTESVILTYQTTKAHDPLASRGVRWDDATFGIRWPVSEPFLSSKDAGYPDFHDRPMSRFPRAR